MPYSKRGEKTVMPPQRRGPTAPASRPAGIRVADAAMFHGNLDLVGDQLARVVFIGLKSTAFG
jgi:hypothetical protein